MKDAFIRWGGGGGGMKDAFIRWGGGGGGMKDAFIQLGLELAWIGVTLSRSR